MDNLAGKYNWKYYRNDKSGNKELTDFIDHLKKSFYSTRQGLKHKLFHIINGEYKSIKFWSAYYHAASMNHMPGKGYEQNLTNSQFENLKENFKDLYGIYFPEDIVVYMIQNHRNATAIEKLLDTVYRINSLMNI